MKSGLKLFDNQAVRTAWNADEELWYFSIVDVIAVLTASPNPRKYWSVLKIRIKKEGDQLTTTCSQLKMESADGKNYLTDVANTTQLLRLIQSIPSPKAEPFKQWLAQVGYERIQETDDPEFAILTDEITRAWSGLSTKEYKQHKNLKAEGLRDHMTNLELVLNMLAEATTTEIAKEKQPIGLTANRVVAKQGGSVAGNARKEIESRTGKPLVSPKNAKQLK